jgi:hypothetical protein
MGGVIIGVGGTAGVSRLPLSPTTPDSGVALASVTEPPVAVSRPLPSASSSSSSLSASRSRK